MVKIPLSPNKLSFKFTFMLKKYLEGPQMILKTKKELTSNALCHRTNRKEANQL